jgi:hypothetical protein
VIGLRLACGQRFRDIQHDQFLNRG